MTRDSPSDHPTRGVAQWSTMGCRPCLIANLPGHLGKFQSRSHRDDSEREAAAMTDDEPAPHIGQSRAHRPSQKTSARGPISMRGKEILSSALGSAILSSALGADASTSPSTSFPAAASIRASAMAGASKRMVVDATPTRAGGGATSNRTVDASRPGQPARRSTLGGGGRDGAAPGVVAFVEAHVPEEEHCRGRPLRGLAAQRRRPRPPRERAAPREREGLELAAAVQADGQHRQVPARVSRARRRAHGPVRDARPLPRA